MSSVSVVGILSGPLARFVWESEGSLLANPDVCGTIVTDVGALLDGDAALCSRTDRWLGKAW